MKTDEMDCEPTDSDRALLSHLFSLLDLDSLCVTSAGYFSKFIQSIIKKRGYELWGWLINNPYVLSGLVKHLDTSHVGDIVEKLIVLDTQDEVQNECTYLSERIGLLKRVISYMLNKSHARDVTENVSELLCEIISKGMMHGTTEIH
jgi:hypothetical protein